MTARGILICYLALGITLAGQARGMGAGALPEPDDPAYAEMAGELYVQWPLHALGATAAWSEYPGSYFDGSTRPLEAPLVAVIDTGVDASHPEFVNRGASGADVGEGGQLELGLARTFITGDALDGTSDARDEHGRGTHLAAVIAAGANNGLTAGSGIAGLGYPVRLLPLKVADGTGWAVWADVARAVRYAADEGAAVILIPLSGSTWSQTLQEAVDYAWEAGCLIVAAAGDEPGEPSFPGACPHVLAVGSLGPEGTIAPYSSAGGWVSLAAPGGTEAARVYSALPTYGCTLRQSGETPAYGWLYGTAEAAAHAAAAAGLVAGALGGWTVRTGEEGKALWQAVQSAAEPPAGEEPGAWTAGYGRGKLRLARPVAGASAASWAGICGRVLNGGRPAVGASVSVTPLEGGEAATVQSTSPAGAYRLPNLTPGRYRVTAALGGASGEWESVALRPACDIPDVDFRVSDPPAGVEIASAELPGAAVRGKTMEVKLVLRNTGESTWRRIDGYGFRQVEVGSVFTFERVGMRPHVSVAPGETWEASVEVPVPDMCGFGSLALQMAQDGGQGRFGESVGWTASITSFLDVSADFWAVGEIEAAAAAEVVKGYPDSTYHPGEAVTRDQMAVYLSRAVMGGDRNVPAGPEQPTFPDVGPEHWAYRYVEFVHGRDIAQGFPDGAYWPGMELDRAQMAVFVARAMAGGAGALEGYAAPVVPSFPDVSLDSWAYREVEYVKQQEVVRGYDDGLYHPERGCTRDQMAVYVARGFGLET